MEKFKEIINQLSRKPNDKQLAAINVLDNAVVGAGAGSGKTTVLSFRFLRLVMDGYANVDQILTLTFTKKAASEMYQRIHANLLEYQITNPELSKQLSLFPKATISTIDSFCAQIVRQDCIGYGIPSNFILDDDISKQNAIRCIEDLLETENMLPGFQFLSKAYSPDELMSNLLIPLANQCLFMPLEIKPSELMDSLNGIIEKEYDLIRSQLVLVTKNIVDISTKGLTAKQKEIVESFSELNELLENPETPFLELSNCVANINFRMPSGKKENALLLKEYCGEFKDLVKSSFITYASMKVENYNEEIFEALVALKDKIFSEKRKSGILNFSDVANLSVDILKNNKDVRTFMKNKFKFIMIDEFQDNNELQKNLLFLLSEKYDECNDGIPAIDHIESQKLFFVGDEKQSIYRFRGADVSVFKSLAQQLESFGGKKLSLETNYRSEPNLIKFFNNIFPGIMENGGEPYEAKFEELGYRDATPSVKPVIKALIKQYDKDEFLENKEDEAGESFSSEAVAVAKEIKKALTTDEYLLKNGIRPTVSDIAILMEKKTGQMYYEKALRVHSIPYIILDNKSLTQEALTNDIYCILQLLLFPNDKISLAATLRGPFGQISDDTAFVIMNTKKDEMFGFGDEYEIKDSELQKIEGLKNTFNTLIAKSKVLKNSELIDFLWYEAGLRYFYICESSYHSYLNNYEYLYRLARANDNKSLSMFLDTLRPQLGQINQLNEIVVLNEKTEGVKIMTIHKSKGLEFPLVFICCMGSGPMNKPSSYVVDNDIPYTKDHVEDHQYKNFVQGLQKDRVKLELLAEKKRILYVAMTRAEMHLVLVGTFNMTNRNTSNDPTKNNNLLLMSLYGAKVDKDTLKCNLEGEPKLICESIPLVPTKALYANNFNSLIKNKDTYKKALEYYDDEPINFKSTPKSIAVTKLFNNKDDGHFVGNCEYLGSTKCDDLLASLVDSFPSIYAEFGTLAHAYVENAILDMQEPLFENCLKKDSPILTLKAEDKKLIIESIREFNRNFINSDFYNTKVLNKNIRCEVGFFSSVRYKETDTVAEGFIDLLIKDDNDNYLVIDFKTDIIKNPEIHKTQLSTYQEVVSKMNKTSSVKCALVYLRKSDSEYYF
ncbi:MAG: UvrD-helicase domain-containing protein [Spirochaetaceae bacterium]|nr:UvrD-helicase domain-containing protein [Spirochaetaceae bacterium]